MEYKFSELKKKTVINVFDGKSLGKIEDIVISYPEGKIEAFIVSEKKLMFGGEKLEMNLCCIDKIGDDTILVDLKSQEKNNEE